MSSSLNALTVAIESKFTLSVERYTMNESASSTLCHESEAVHESVHIAVNPLGAVGTFSGAASSASRLTWSKIASYVSPDVCPLHDAMPT